ncbi:glycerol-3-phosphate dehydrogenase [Pseudoprimorskyibacter insulae]|uniref:Glycerol-3-phosphate dehydrogenase n=1 Tax=Pseudoprimorskyibacter insulae TaxID=1695997 RepID=A0A2R8AU93_9RHOB|nr:glycerol-3-phosphate dehydrogenase [Pseudoprimorskyibacter insulae]SPF79550.1 Aerobic glycerol-3-phosphate dehydrogenase [Pseudoprimorskyibacter insulae]
MAHPHDAYDLFIIGGGINGCGIARDAAGRGLSVGLAEKGDLASATSSASTKLFHGGLRYLEYFEFRLVREALIEREVLLRAMPHISWPMRFVLPLHSGMRFDSSTPTSRLLQMVMPWMKGRRPAWLIRLGLFLYDHLGGREILPGTRSLSLNGTPEGAPLQDHYRRAYEYSDCWVEDARLVVLNARDAEARGATILTRTEVTQARREGDLWDVEVMRNGQPQTIKARMLVNAAGPWSAHVLGDIAKLPTRAGIRLVRGSHIVTRRLFDHDKCYFFQGTDGRIIFAIPYEGDFTLIGTTDTDHADPDQPPRCTDQERDYLCAFASRYFKTAITPDDVVWTYSGVRPLYDDGAGSASAATRDYTLTLDADGPPILNVFGGKITTYRKLAESALRKIGAYLPNVGTDWTAGIPLPGGDFPMDGVQALREALRQDYPFLTAPWAARLIRAYGTEARLILGTAKAATDLGQSLGATLTAAEVDWLIDKEYAQSAEDILWRRSKLGLRMTPEDTDKLGNYIAQRLATKSPATE